MSDFSIKLTGVKQMLAKIAKLRADFKKASARALYQEAQIVLTDAKRRTPVDTGVLRVSGFVSTPKEGRGDGVTVEIGFGGASAAYAVYVHENLEAYHATGEAKFLENAVNASAPNFMSNIAKRIKADLSGGKGGE